MVAQVFFRSTRLILLVAAGVCFAFLAGAQIPTQNLFRRAQFIEYLRLRNQSIYNRAASGQVMSADTRPGQLVEFNLKCKTNRTVHSIWLTGEVHFAFSRWNDAAEVFRQLIKTDSSFCDAYFRLSQCYVAQNDLTAGYQVLVLAKSRFPDNPLLNLGFGQLYILLSFPRTALYYFEKQIILHPEDPEGYLGASWSAHELNDDVKAILYLKKGRELLTEQIVTAAGSLTTPMTVSLSGPKNPLVPTLDYLYLFESMLYNNLNENEKSREALKHLINDDEDGIAAFKYYCVGMYYYNKGESFYNKARKNISRAAAADLYVDPAVLRQLGIRSDPTDFKAMALRENYSRVSTQMSSAKSPLLLKGDTLFQNRYFAAAAESYALCIRADSANLIAFERLGECYREMRRQDEAISIYQLANRKFPEEIKFTLLLAREQMRTGQSMQAIANYRKAISLDNKNYQAYYGACLGLAHIGEYGKALELWNSGKKHLPAGKPQSLFMSGVLYYGLGYYHIAATSLNNRRLINDAASNYYLALSYHYLEDQEEQARARAAENMIDAIKLGAIVNSETVKMMGLDPAVHRSY